MSVYCISDIHGHYDEFQMMLEKIKFGQDDTMYILGDIIDKGKDSIKTLLFIMHDPRFIVLLGNHDYMMYCYLKHAIQGLSTERDEYLWLQLNYGYPTYFEYLQCNQQQQNEIFVFISHLPVVIPNVKVGDKQFYLVHSCPDFSYTETMTMKELSDEEDALVPFIWERWLFIDCPVITIAGHTINRNGKIRHFEAYNYWDIDCGCAANIALGCLRLDDFQEFYVQCN